MLLLMGLGQLLFGSVPLILFGVAIVTASRFAGIVGGVFSIVLSTLAADFFFIPPIFAFNLDQSTGILAVKYSLIGLLSYLIFERKRRRVQAAKASLAAFGHLDGVRDGEVYGWAMNPEEPESPARVAAYLNGKPVAEAMALYYRSDVAEHFSCSGRNGFFVDLARASSIAGNAMVDVRLSSGEYLDGGPLRAYVPIRRLSAEPTLLFMHIPKTAGTALRETILNNYRKSEIAFLYPDPPGFPIQTLGELPLAQREMLRLVVGHFQYGIHEHLPNEFLYFTVVRHPLARIRSHYNYMVAFKHPQIVTNKHVKTLQEAIEGRATVNLDNLMVRCFSGVSEKNFPPGSIDQDIYDLARRHAETAFVYVGQQEQLAAAYAFLQERFRWNWSIAPEMMNVGPDAPKGQLDELTPEFIKRFDHWDLKLYEHIRQIFPPCQ